MAADYPPLTQGEIDELFIQVEPPAPNTFEFALVLGGTVSAGAYTAGAVDFLIEALDCWTTARDKHDAPDSTGCSSNSSRGHRAVASTL